MRDDRGLMGGSAATPVLTPNPASEGNTGLLPLSGVGEGVIRARAAQSLARRRGGRGIRFAAARGKESVWTPSP